TGFPVTPYVPCHTDSRAEVILIRRKNATRNSGVSRIHQSRRRVWDLLRLPAGNEVGRQVVGLIGRLLIVIANSKIQREAAVHPKVVLRKQTEKVGAVVLALAQHLEEARAADEEVSHRVSGILPIKGEPAIIESRKARSESDRMVFASEFPRTAPLDPG